MPTLPKIMSEKKSAQDLKQIMDTMKGIAMSAFVEFKKKREKRFEKFNESFEEFFYLTDLTRAKNPFIVTDCPKIGVVAITSNESFMAGLNNKIIKMGMEKTKDRPKHFVLTGPRMIGRLKSEGSEYTVFPGFKEKNMYAVAVQIKDFVLNKIQSGELGKVIAVFADPVSMSNQVIRAVTLFPIHDLVQSPDRVEADSDETLCQESSTESIVQFLGEIWVTNKLIQMFEDNKMSEYAAQAMQLDASLENLKDLEKRLRLQFVKTKREIIDASLRETVAAMMVSAAR